jgi:hypothetical protein
VGEGVGLLGNCQGPTPPLHRREWEPLNTYVAPYLRHARWAWLTNLPLPVIG